MKTYEENNIMAISENARSAADEPRVLCIVRDLTNPQGCQQRNVSLPASYTVRNLRDHISKDYGYQPESFNLLYERNSNTELLAEGNQRLDELSACSTNKKMKFQITELEDGVLPIKVKTETSSGRVQFDEIPVGSGACNGDPPSYQQATSMPYPNVGFGSAPPQPAPAEFCGLVNQAMTCYLNSLLQTLFMTPEFRNALYSWEYKRENAQASEDKCIPYQLQRLFLHMQMGKQRAVETTPVTRSFGWDSSHSWQQHDVQELCRVMFDALEINFKKTQQADLINELYQGKLKDYVKCLECKSESFRTDAYLDIPLVIKPFGATKAFPSVEAALKAFIEPEILQGANQYQCDRCDKKCDAHKGLKFVTFPYLLTLQLKRFDFDYSTMNRIKLNDRMTFPGWLDLNGMVDDNCMPPTPNLKSTPPDFTTDYDISADPDILESFDDVIGAELVAEKGEYIYELFSVMIHSGSAVGGHYYAYIKCFADGRWYSFNDQSVTAITTEDIKKTFGGSASRGIYSTTYTSSTNAYMLMYRRFDQDINAKFKLDSELPPHIKQLMEKMEREAEISKQHKEKQKCMCRIPTYIYHPKVKKRISQTLEIDKDESLDAAVLQAYQMFELESLVDLDCVRLVRYNCDHEYIDRSFDPTETETIGQALGGVRSMYTFELLLELKEPEHTWQEYRLGGVTFKVHVVDIEAADVLPHVNVRTVLDDKVSDLKQKIASVLNLPLIASMRCILEKRSSSELVLLDDAAQSLKDFGHSQGTKVFVDRSLDYTDDCKVPFKESAMHRLLEAYQYTVRLLLTVPSSNEVQRFLDKERARSLAGRFAAEDQEVKEGFDALSRRKPQHNGPLHAKDRDSTELSDGIEPVTAQLSRQNPFLDGSEDKSPESAIECNGPPLCAKLSPIFDQSASEGSPLISSSAEGSCKGMHKDAPVSSSPTIPDAREGQVWDYTENCEPKAAANSGNTTADAALSRDLDAYSSGSGRGRASESSMDSSEGQDEIFKVTSEDESEDGKTRVLTIQMDKRIRLKRFKHLLQKRLHVPVTNFKLYKVYSNNQEIECTTNTDTLNLLGNDSRMIVKLGRALGKGEYKVKIFELELNVNKEEPTPYLFDLIVMRGMTIAQAKKCITDELFVEHKRQVSPKRIRLRKKTWKNPSQVYLDHQRIEDDISMYSNWEMFIQILDDCEPLTSQTDMILFAQQWKPSVYEFGPMFEIIVPSAADLRQLKEKLSEESGIEADFIDIAKGRGTFPGDVSVLEAHTTGLDWNPNVTHITSWPLFLDSGGIIIFRDSQEKLATLTAEKRKEIGVKEGGSAQYRQSGSMGVRREKALKIYTHIDEPAPANTLDDCVNQPSELD